MPSFTYSARSRAGEKVDGMVNANNRRGAMMEIERLGYMPISVKEGAGAPQKKSTSSKKSPAKKAAPKAPAKKAPVKKTASGAKAKTGDAPKSKFQFEARARKRMKLRETLLFARELRDLLSSGMKLSEALGSLAKREGNPGTSYTLGALRDDINQGSSLSEALGQHPDSFSPFFVNMVRAGEASGQLNGALSHVSDHYERVLDAKEQVTMALVYPIIVLVIGFATVVFCMWKVIPKFTIIFQDLNSTLPLPTQILIGISDFTVRYGVILIAVNILLIVLFLRAIKTPAGRYKWHGFLLKVPVLNRLIQANAYAHFARTLGGLLENGVPVLSALKIVEDTVGNDIIAQQIREARERVTDGASISKPLAEGGVFPSILTDMLKVGEDSGNVSGALHHISTRYDDELTRSVKMFTTVLEPVLMVLMAAVVGFIAVSMLMAVFEMTNGLDV
jgi:type IV pilus assembly protein PilC